MLSRTSPAQHPNNSHTSLTPSILASTFVTPVFRIPYVVSIFSCLIYSLSYNMSSFYVGWEFWCIVYLIEGNNNADRGNMDIITGEKYVGVSCLCSMLIVFVGCTLSTWRNFIFLGYSIHKESHLKSSSYLFYISHYMFLLSICISILELDVAE